MPTPDQIELGQVQLELAQEFGVGGSRWAGERVEGDGVDTPVTMVAAPTVTAYVRQVQAPVVTPAGPAFLGDTRWVLHAPAAQDIRVGDVCWSVAEPDYRFQVLTVNTRRGIIEADLERVG